MSRGIALGRWGLAATGLAVVLLVGCSGRHTVRGQLVYEDNDQPVSELEGQEVIFTSEKLGVMAHGTVQKDGRFQLGTDQENDGALPGEYVVTLTQPFREPDRPYTGDRVVDKAYEDADTSDLRAEVTSSKNDFTFKLRRYVKPKKERR